MNDEVRNSLIRRRRILGTRTVLMGEMNEVRNSLIRRSRVLGTRTRPSRVESSSSSSSYLELQVEAASESVLVCKQRRRCQTRSNHFFSHPRAIPTLIPEHVLVLSSFVTFVLWCPEHVLFLSSFITFMLWCPEHVLFLFGFVTFVLWCPKHVLVPI
jgi:hypothetical protein